MTPSDIATDMILFAQTTGCTFCPGSPSIYPESQQSGLLVTGPGAFADVQKWTSSYNPSGYTNMPNPAEFQCQTSSSPDSAKYASPMCDYSSPTGNRPWSYSSGASGDFVAGSHVHSPKGATSMGLSGGLVSPLGSFDDDIINCHSGLISPVMASSRFASAKWVPPADTRLYTSVSEQPASPSQQNQSYVPSPDYELHQTHHGQPSVVNPAYGDLGSNARRATFHSFHPDIDTGGTPTSATNVQEPLGEYQEPDYYKLPETATRRSASKSTAWGGLRQKLTKFTKFGQDWTAGIPKESLGTRQTGSRSHAGQKLVTGAMQYVYKSRWGRKEDKPAGE